MWDILRRWHPLILVAMGIYLAIPKPGPNPAEIDEEFLVEYDKNEDGVVDKDEFGGLDFELRDRDKSGKLTVGSRFRWPLHDYKWNLGQDLKGGSSLRYVLKQQDMEEAERSVNELLAPLSESMDRLSPEARAKFGRVIEGGELRLNEWADEDYALLRVPGSFDEGHADALKRFYTRWSSAKQRKEDKDLVGPTIETLNRRLGATGITELNIVPVGDERIEVKLPEFATASETDRYKQLLETTGKLEMRVLAAEDSDFTRLNVGEFPKEESYKYKWIELDRDDATTSALVKERDGKKYVPVQMIDEYDITGKDLQNIQASTDQQGRMAVSFELKGLAVARFENLSRTHKELAAGGEDPRLLAVLIDEKVFSAYSIKDTISGAVQLSGDFNAKERDDIINVLKSGSLNVKLVLEGEETVGPSEGAEAVKRGLWSFVIAAIFVFLFALWLYRGLGLLVVFNLLTIIVLIMGAMSVGLGTLTLPGIAGLVLTFGMAIDGNILINERMREELARGMPTRAAAEEGFKNAFSAIIDSNITTLLTALILYKVGSGPVQGFALTVAIGIVATLYANIPAYRSMIMGMLSIKRDLRFSMQSLSWLENRNINFVGGMKIAVPVGIIASLLGLVLLLNLGQSVLGMEFRGGYAFRVQTDKGYERDELAALLVDESTGEPKYEWANGMEIQPVFRLGNTPEGGGADRFDLRFPMRDEWLNTPPEEMTATLRTNIEEILAEKLVEDGWTARAAAVRESTFEAKFALVLKDAEKFRELYPEDFDKMWLIKDRSWGNDRNAARAKMGTWFGEVAPGDIEVSFTPGAAGDRQTMSVRALKVPVSDESDLVKRYDAFKAAVMKYFWQDSEHVNLEGNATFSQFPTKGILLVKVILLEPVNVTEFSEFIERASVVTGLSLKVTALNPDAERAAGFELTSGETTFSENPTDPQHFSQVESQLHASIAKWIAENGGEGNEISKRFLLSSAIGATVADEMQWRALFAVLAALVVIVIYMRVRFASLAWGVAAIAALIFDVTVTLSALAIADTLGADMKIDLVIVAAVMTVIGYALNDVIVNFDRIRESLKKDRLATGGKTPLRDIINQAANFMLPRTLMTGGTTLTSTAIMMMFGGPLLASFSFVIFVGVVMGTFSSVFIAAPVLLLLDKRGSGDLLDMADEEAIEVERAAAKALAASEDSEPPQDEAEEEEEEGEEPKKNDTPSDKQA